MAILFGVAKPFVHFSIKNNKIILNHFDFGPTVKILNNITDLLRIMTSLSDKNKAYKEENFSFLLIYH